jgi:hypothetical protein
LVHVQVVLNSSCKKVAAADMKAVALSILLSGWTVELMDSHRSRSIPDHVDENLLALALAGQPLTDDPTPAETL